MIRVVLAVCLTVALLGVSLPVVDDARQERTAARMDRTVDRLAVAAATLRSDDPTRSPALAPRRTVDLWLPDESWGAVAVERLRLTGASSTAPATVSVTLPGQRPTTVRVDAPLATPAGPLVLREPGEHRLVFRLLRRGGGVVVLVTEG